MSETTDNAPQIAPVPAGEARPLWSVMIPTFNCANYLRQTLASVLAQAPGPEQMQIEVVDDCSTKDDPESVVREVGQGRVTFYRKPKNEGATRNFNTCIARSRGHLVHILHGDDYVLPGFYEKLTAAASARPELALYACRAFYVDEEGIIFGVTERVRSLEAGGKSVADYYYNNPTQTPTVVVRRSFYERHGGFSLQLIHTADCEMWTRAISFGGGVVLSEVLCGYRQFGANDSGRLARSAENLRDHQRLHSIFERRYPDFDPRRAEFMLAHISWVQINRFKAKGDAEAVRANSDFRRQTIPLRLRLRQSVVRLGRAVLG